MPRKGENIYKRKDGRWEGRYIKSRNNHNKSKYGYVYGRTYKEVKSKLILAKSEVSTELSNSARQTEVYNYWLDKWLVNKKSLVKESTFIRYRNLIENHIKPNLGKLNITEINNSCIQQYISRKSIDGRIDGCGGLSPKTLYDIILIIRESLKYINETNDSVNFDIGKITIKKSNHDMRVLTISEEKKLNSVLLDNTDRYKLGILICLYTGIRIGELCALRWKNISMDDKTMKIESTLQRLQCEDKEADTKTRIIISEPKTFSSMRIIPIPDFLFLIIQRFRSSPNSFVLTGSEQSFIEPRTMQNYFKKYLALGEIRNANFHCLRHTFATRCIESGFDIKTLSEILGHSSVKVTLDKYVHTTMKLKKDNMEKLKLAI